MQKFGGQALTVICSYALNTSSEYPVFLETLDGVLEGAPSGDSILLFRGINVHVGNKGNEKPDWEEQPAQSETEQWSIFGLLC